MDPLTTDVARAVVTERLRQAGTHNATHVTSTNTSTTTRTTSMQRILASRVAVVVYAVIGLLITVSGTATATALITGAQIQDGSVHSRDITDGTLTGTDVKDKSLTPTDFTGSLQGPAGPQGADGPQGPAGASGLQYVVNGINITAGDTGYVSANCPVGKKVVGGGASSTNPYYARMVESAPLDNGTGWHVGLRNQGSSAFSAYAWAVCVTA